MGIMTMIKRCNRGLRNLIPGEEDDNDMKDGVAIAVALVDLYGY